MRHEGIKAKTLGRRYPEAFLPNAPQALATEAFQAKTLGSEGHFEIHEKNRKIYEYGKSIID